jgi:transposase IS4-like protein/DDE family transposase
MGVGEAIDALGGSERPASFDQFSAALDPQWIADALAATGTASVRRRKLPAEHVVWLVIGMGLFRDRSIAQVVHHLDLVVSTAGGERRRITNGAIVQARDQLGAAPLAALFAQTAQAWAPPAAAADRWRGLAVYGLDGTTLRVADTPENVAHFGRPPSRHGEGAGYPQLRLVTLLTLRARLLAATAFGPYRTSEVALAQEVWGALPEHAVVILDRGFCGYALFHALATPDRDRHWLVRARSGPTALTQAVVERLGSGDALVELRPSRATWAKHPDLPPTLRVRAVRVQRRGFRPYWVFTSLLNQATHPAAEIAALYHERWELELAFDELKTHTCERVEALRSKAPIRVEQEVWGLLLAYNLVRLVMSRAAPRARVPPGRLSYRYALLAVRAFWHAAWDTSPGTLPRRLERLLDELTGFVLPERRARRYPRAVKIKMSNYPRNRPHRRRSRAK